MDCGCYMKTLLLFAALSLSLYAHADSALLQPIPEKLVVLTFDDAVSNHATYVAPKLKQLGFGATFYVCEFQPDFETNKEQYMTWEQIRSLHEMGFEVGNHTGHHKHVNGLKKAQLIEEIEFIEKRCSEYSIPRPTTFCYPAYATSGECLTVLSEKGYTFAREGHNRIYEPNKDDPLLIPSISLSGDKTKPFYDALQQAKDGRIVVFTFHGVPEHTHPWVNTPPAIFDEYMKYLADNHFTVIAVRDLARFIDPVKARSAIKVNKQ